MKYLIIYGSKYGFTKECTEKLANLLDGDCRIFSSKEIGNINISIFDHIIIGSSVYVGQIDKKIKEFVSKNENDLLNKKVSLFLCCGSQANETEEIYKNNFSSSFLLHSNLKECFGGEFRTDKMGFLSRFIISKVSKSKEHENKPQPKYIDGSIEKFAEIINISNRGLIWKNF